MRSPKSKVKGNKRESGVQHPTPRTPKKFFFILLFLMTLGVGHWTLDSLNAQPDVGVSVTPGASDPYYDLYRSTSPEEFVLDDFAVQLADELLASKTTDFWSRIQISTSQPYQEITLYVRRGFGRAELITLMMIAEAAHKQLKDLAKERIGGATLRELCVNNNIAYDALRSQARALKEKLLVNMRLKLDNEHHGPGKSEAADTGGSISTGTAASIELSTGIAPGSNSGEKP
ncbi:MAG: hypothetical protein HY547_09070 [Elusimicrobia bacterium]|nr:hypothetical protein [Elusimicrobiota bacterium]